MDLDRDTLRGDGPAIGGDGPAIGRDGYRDDVIPMPRQVLAIRPEPLATMVTHERHSAGASTSIARLFSPADVRRCRLCQECRANALGFCLVTVPDHVPDHAARLFSLADWERARGPG